MILFFFRKLEFSGVSHHRSPKQVENIHLPPHRREERSLKISNGEHSNPIRTTAPQRVYANTNSVTQPKVYNEPLPFAGGMGALFHHP